MSLAQIFLLEGRPDAEKRAVIQKVTQALHEATGEPKEKIRVWISDVPDSNWGIAGHMVKDLRSRASSSPSTPPAPQRRVAIIAKQVIQKVEKPPVAVPVKRRRSDH